MSLFFVCPTFDLGDKYKKYCQKWGGVGWGGVGLEKRYKGGFGHKGMSKEGGLKLSAQSVLTIEGNMSFDI